MNALWPIKIIESYIDDQGSLILGIDITLGLGFLIKIVQASPSTHYSPQA